MATGMEMLVNAALKATGFDRAQLDDGLTQGKAKLEEFDSRFRRIEADIRDVHTMMQTIVEHINRNQGSAHAADVDAASN